MARGIVGLVQLERKLKLLPRGVEDEIRKVIAASADEIVRLAKSLVPDDSGELQKSIGWTWGRAPRGALTLGKVAASQIAGSLTATIYAGDDKAFYARWVEFGTAPHIAGGKFKGAQHPGTTAQPFFFPAYRASRKRAKSNIRRAINKAAKRVAAGG